MRHRLFYLVPDLSSAARARDDLLLHRIEARHMHFLANTPLPPDLPEATVFHKTDIVHGAELGAMIGAGLGLLLGLFLIGGAQIGIPKNPLIVLLCAGVFAGLGAWVASMIAAAIPNSRLAAFTGEVEQGRILLIVDVPARRVTEIEDLLATHSDMKFEGEDPNIPAFP